ncbi:hypothetical protein V1509DRAFT_633194 [Lipomyces kononenkoae]
MLARKNDSTFRSVNEELLSHSRDLDTDAQASALSFTTVRYPSKSNKSANKPSNRRRKAQSSKYKVTLDKTAEDYIGSIPYKVNILKRQGKFYNALFGSSVAVGVLFTALAQGRKAEAAAVQHDDDSKSSRNSPQSHEIKYIRCLALGRVSDSDISRMQLAVLLALRDELGVPHTNVTCYDPDFVPMDKEILRGFSIEITEEPGEGDDDEDDDFGLDDEELVQRRRQTLYYMPHAPIFLVDKIMGLDGVQYVLGNDVLGYKERLEEELELVFKSLKEIVLSCDRDNNNIADETGEIDDGQDGDRHNNNNYLAYDPGWTRLRLEDGLSREESWWLSVNDLAMHWRTAHI